MELLIILFGICYLAFRFLSEDFGLGGGGALVLILAGLLILFILGAILLSDIGPVVGYGLGLAFIAVVIYCICCDIKASRKNKKIDSEITKENVVVAAEKTSEVLIREGLFAIENQPSEGETDNHKHEKSQTYFRKKRTQQQNEKRSKEILNQFHNEDTFANDDVWST